MHLVRALVTSVGSESLPLNGQRSRGILCCRDRVRGSQTNPGRQSRSRRGAAARGSQRWHKAGRPLRRQRSEQAVSSRGRAGLDDREGVAPGRPVSGDESCCERRAGRPAQLGAPCWKGCARSRRTMRGRETGRIPTEPATTLPPPAMQIALRRHLRQPLPMHSNTCGPPHGCGGAVDRFGDHALACPRAGLLAWRAKIVERAWVRVAREGVGRASRSAAVVGPHHRPASERRTVADSTSSCTGPLSSGGAQCCDATLVSPLSRSGHPQPCAAAVDAASVRLPRTRPGRATDAGCARLRSGGPLERPGPQLRARPGAPQGVPRPSSRARGGDCRLGAALVEHAVRGGAAGSRQYGSAGCSRRPARRSTASSTMPPQRATAACPCGPSEGLCRGGCSWAQRRLR